MRKNAIANERSQRKVNRNKKNFPVNDSLDGANEFIEWANEFPHRVSDITRGMRATLIAMRATITCWVSDLSLDSSGFLDATGGKDFIAANKQQVTPFFSS